MTVEERLAVAAGHRLVSAEVDLTILVAAAAKCAGASVQGDARPAANSKLAVDAACKLA